jgi:hypothetical protein
MPLSRLTTFQETDAGGYIVAEGTPEQLSMVNTSYTGQHIRKVLSVEAVYNHSSRI